MFLLREFDLDVEACSTRKMGTSELSGWDDIVVECEPFLDEHYGD